MATRVSVVMAVCNGERFLRQAVESILRQTWPDFEFIVVDDGSTDSTREILADFVRIDSRLQLVVQEKSGIAQALNSGWRRASGVYIARMDADDVSLPERLARQFAFLEAHPDTGVCGAGFRTLGARKDYTRIQPTDDADIRCRMLFQATLLHPSVMMRRSLLAQVGGYNPDSLYAQDYELWTQLLPLTRFASLGEVLMLYRIHRRQVSDRNADLQFQHSSQVQMGFLRRLGLEPSGPDLALHARISRGDFEASRDFVSHAEAWLLKLRRANAARPICPEPSLSRELGRRWFQICRGAQDLGLWTLQAFLRSSLSMAAARSAPEILQFGWACLRAGGGATYP